MTMVRLAIGVARNQHWESPKRAFSIQNSIDVSLAVTSPHPCAPPAISRRQPCPNPALRRENPMRILLRTLFLGFAAAASLSPARAAAGDCGDVAAMVQQAYPKARKSADGASFTLEPHTSIALTHADGDTPFGLVCKVWPAHDDLLLVAVPLIDSSQPSDYAHVGDIELLIVDRNSLQVRQRLLQPGLMTDDGFSSTKRAMFCS